MGVPEHFSIYWFYIVLPYGGIIAFFHILVRASGFGSASLQGVNEALAKCKLLAKMSRGWNLCSELSSKGLVGESRSDDGPKLRRYTQLMKPCNYNTI